MRKERRYVSLGTVGYIDKENQIALTDQSTRYNIVEGEKIQIGDKIIFDKQEKKSFIRREFR